MFPKEASRLLRQEFWTSFGKSFPNKWILYDTKIKGFAFKFYFDTTKAMVTLDIEHANLEIRRIYFKKLKSLQSVMTTEYVPDVQFAEKYPLENGKEISRIFVVLQNVSIHDKNTWQTTMEFLSGTMKNFESFWMDYETVIKH